SRSISIESSTCSTISRSCSVPVSWISRSASVDLPWSMWATIEKLRMLSMAEAVMGRQITLVPASGKDGFVSRVSLHSPEKPGLLQQPLRLRRDILWRSQHLLDNALHLFAQHRVNLEVQSLGLGQELGVLHSGRECCSQCCHAVRRCRVGCE